MVPTLTTDPEYRLEHIDPRAALPPTFDSLPPTILPKRVFLKKICNYLCIIMHKVCNN